MKAPYAIIGGTGFYHPHLLDNLQELNINTKYGIVPLQLGDYQGKTIVFLARHGKDHHLPPHRINYRANMAALKELDVSCVLSTTAV
ncbi:MAG TPA: 5'-methylthioadenosine phosphorylase, partial [Firmicutes bacterium]|nr:5'-methylthioadenosine phosphorylase [Bacillota bacterium]